MKTLVISKETATKDATQEAVEASIPVSAPGAPIGTAALPRVCPRCRSGRVHRSHRRAMVDYIFYALGAEIRRCRDCRRRHASFVHFSVPLGDPQNMARHWTALLIMVSGFLLCLAFILWMIRRFTEMSG